MLRVKARRKGPQTRQQVLQELLRKAAHATDKYYAGGRIKEGADQPRPITLPKISFK